MSTFDMKSDANFMFYEKTSEKLLLENFQQPLSTRDSKIPTVKIILNQADDRELIQQQIINKQLADEES
jgi:hypothetical protein